MENIEKETRGSADAKSWATDRVARIGRAVAERRQELGLTAVDLAARTTELGYPITRGAIAKIENGLRQGRLDIAELVILAYALHMPPILLLYPGVCDELVKTYPDGSDQTAINAIRSFDGSVIPLFAFGRGGRDIDPSEITTVLREGEKESRKPARRLELAREWAHLDSNISALRTEYDRAEDEAEEQRISKERRALEAERDALQPEMDELGMEYFASPNSNRRYTLNSKFFDA